MNSDDKALVSGGAQYRRVEVKRTVRAPIQRVWRAITDPDEVARWWAPGVVESREGGRVRLTNDDSDCDPNAPPLDGRVKVCLPPYIFEFTWNEASDPAMGLVRFDLVEIDEHTTLVTLVNTVPVSDLAEAAVGWHTLLDRLRDHAGGSDLPAVPDEGYLASLQALYST